MLKQLHLIIIFLVTACIQPAYGMEDQPNSSYEVITTIPTDSSITASKKHIAIISDNKFQLFDLNKKKTIIECNNNSYNCEFDDVAFSPDEKKITIRKFLDIKTYNIESKDLESHNNLDQNITSMRYHPTNNNLVLAYSSSKDPDIDNFIEIHFCNKENIQNPYQKKIFTNIFPIKRQYDRSSFGKSPDTIRRIIAHHPKKNEFAIQLQDGSFNIHDISSPDIDSDKIHYINWTLNQLFIFKELKNLLLKTLFETYKKNPISYNINIPTPLSHPMMHHYRNADFLKHNESDHPYTAIKYSPDGNYLMTISRNFIAIHDEAKNYASQLLSSQRISGKKYKKRTHDDDFSSIITAAFHPNNKIIIAINDAGLITYWPIENIQQAMPLYRHQAPIIPHKHDALVPSPDGTQLFVATSNQLISYKIPQKIINFTPPDKAIKIVAQMNKKLPYVASTENALVISDPIDKETFTEQDTPIPQQEIAQTNPTQTPPDHPAPTFWQNNSTLIKTTLGLGGIIAAWLWYYRSHR